MRNRWLLCVIAVLMCVCLLSGIGFADGETAGDVNDDRKTDMADAAYLLPAMRRSVSA